MRDIVGHHLGKKGEIMALEWAILRGFKAKLAAALVEAGNEAAPAPDG